MSAEINYKNKYLALRGKYMNDLDMAFRLGFEQGQQQAQQDQAMQAQQEQAQMDQMMAQAQGGGAPGQEGGESGEAAPGQPSEAPMEGAGGSELDQHIAKLESMINGAPGGASEEIQKSLQSLKALRKAELDKIQFKKSEQAVKGIARALHKPAHKLSVLASHNLSSCAKAAVSMQHKIVNDVMSKMHEEEQRASSDIKNILSVEGITKKE